MGRRKSPRKVYGAEQHIREKERRVRRWINVCPNCGKPMALTYEIREDSNWDKTFKVARVRCFYCELDITMYVPQIYEKYDVYSKLVDLVERGAVTGTYDFVGVGRE